MQGASIDAWLDDETLDTLDSRFLSLRNLLTRDDLPSADELTELFVGWEVDMMTARKAALFALKALQDAPTEKLQELAESSPTMAMLYDVFQNSSQYWHETPDIFSSKTDKYEVIMTIVMDTEGGLGGLIFGAIGALLGAAVYSILWVVTGP